MLRNAAPAGFEPPKSPTQLDVSWVTSTGAVARNLGRLGSRQRQRRPMLARTPPYRQWVKECLPVEGLPPTLSLTSATSHPAKHCRLPIRSRGRRAPLRPRALPVARRGLDTNPGKASACPVERCPAAFSSSIRVLRPKSQSRTAFQVFNAFSFLANQVPAGTPHQQAFLSAWTEVVLLQAGLICERQALAWVTLEGVDQSKLA